jgi:hypothetical protein
MLIGAAFADTADSGPCEAEIDGYCWNPLEDWCSKGPYFCEPVSERSPEAIWECLGNGEPRYLSFSYENEIEVTMYRHYNSRGELIAVVQRGGSGGVAWGDFQGQCLAPGPALIPPWSAPDAQCAEAKEPKGCALRPGGKPWLGFLLGFSLLLLRRR